MVFNLPSLVDRADRGDADPEAEMGDRPAFFNLTTVHVG
jgi:hypothetical protein